MTESLIIIFALSTVIAGIVGLLIIFSQPSTKTKDQGDRNSQIKE